MNWLSTDVHKAHRNCLPLFACLMLACAVPLVFCREENGISQDKHKGVAGSGDILLRHSKVHWTQHDKVGRHLTEPTFRMKSYTKQRRNKDDLQKPWKSHDKHKKPARNRSKFHKDSSISQEKAKKNHLNYLESEKKYFDYFPIEDTHDKLVPLRDENVGVVLLLNDTSTRGNLLTIPTTNKKEQKRSRSKREIPEPETYASTNYNYVKNFLATEQGNKLPPILGLTNKINQGDQYHSQGTANDPWNNRFTQPLNNFYLPVQRPFVPVSVPHIKYPIPGIYFNAVSPSGNHPVLSPVPSVVNRFTGDEDRVIWEIKYVGGASNSPAASLPGGGFGGSFEGGSTSSGGFGSSASSGGFRTTTAPSVTRPPSSTRAPAPPLIHQENRGRNTKEIRTTQQPFRVSNVIPQTQTNVKPTVRTTQAPNPAEPSKCVWAIVSCCSRNDLRVRYNCFEQIGCHGAFWDYNPCADNLQDAALKEADRFFQS